jgi:hypothetical protein
MQVARASSDFLGDAFRSRVLAGFGPQHDKRFLLGGLLFHRGDELLVEFSIAKLLALELGRHGERQGKRLVADGEVDRFRRGDVSGGRFRETDRIRKRFLAGDDGDGERADEQGLAPPI